MKYLDVGGDDVQKKLWNSLTFLMRSQKIDDVATSELLKQGASTIVFEKSGIIGGTTNLSGGVMQAAGTEYQKEFTEYQDDTPEKHAQEWIAEGEGMLDEDLVTDLANGAPECITWLADTCGIEWVSVYGHCLCFK